MKYEGFSDLNILIGSNDTFPSIDFWCKSHYSTIALNHFVDLTEVCDSKKKKKGEKSEIKIPEPSAVVLPSDYSGKVSVLNRLTIKISDVSQFPKVFQGKSYIVRKFDIIAVMPTEQACLQKACTMNDVDLICVDCQNKPTWKLTKKLYRSAVEQNKYFELCYAPALRDSTTLKNTIYMSHIFYSVGRSKNLIISSGTSDIFFSRSPYEVIHLSFLFGFDENKARPAITFNPANVVERAIKRKLGKSVISVSPN